jgi:hypothetical protein
MTEFRGVISLDELTNTGIKSFRVTLPAEIFYWGF